MSSPSRSTALQQYQQQDRNTQYRPQSQPHLPPSCSRPAQTLDANILALSVWDVPPDLFNGGTVFTTPALAPNITQFDHTHYTMVVQQGYNWRTEGRLIRLWDCPEGYAVWCGAHRYARGDIAWKLHPTVAQQIQQQLGEQQARP